jgi:hypothetical protein
MSTITQAPPGRGSARTHARRTRRIRAAQRHRTDDIDPMRGVELRHVGNRTVAMDPTVGFVTIPGVWTTPEEFTWALARVPLSEIHGQFWD